MANIVTKGLTKCFGSVVAVNEVELNIDDSEFVVLLGGSGCGKSTTLNLIAGLEQPTAGDIYMDGVRINDVPPNERDMAMVFQNYALYPQMTVFENLTFSLKLKKIPLQERKTRAMRIANMLGIQELLDRKPGQLSGGQQQRVALGRAIVRNPKVFLMDEPLSNLDAKLRVKMRSELKRLHMDLGVTTIYVTHDQTEAMTMADKIVLLRDGKIVAYDSPRNLYKYPPNLHTADFLGTPPMNIIRGKIESGDGRLIFSGDSYRLEFGNQLMRRLEEQTRSLPHDIILGIRPEDIVVGDTEQGAYQTYEVYLSEFLGSDTYIHVRPGSQQSIIARAESDSHLMAGDTVTLTFKEDRLHLFNPKTEERIL
jgi:multiple sugar transport system ATP-binding protein